MPGTVVLLASQSSPTANETMLSHYWRLVDGIGAGRVVEWLSLSSLVVATACTVVWMLASHLYGPSSRPGEVAQIGMVVALLMALPGVIVPVGLAVADSIIGLVVSPPSLTVASPPSWLLPFALIYLGTVGLVVFVRQAGQRR